MRKYAKVLSVLLALLAVMALFVGCGKKGDTDSASSQIDVNKVLSTADVNFVDADGESTFRIVRPAGCDSEITTAASKILKGIKDTHGVSVRSVFDEESAENVAEIIIGETNREETKLARQVLLTEGAGRANEYIICTINDDIVIYGMTKDATIKGVEYFVVTYVPTATITGGIHYNFKDAEGFETYTVAGNSKLVNTKIVRPIYNVSFLTQIEIDKLVKLIYETSGYEMDITHDQVASNTGNTLDGSGTLTKTEPSEYEIIIGNCVRDGVKTITDKNAYEIRVEGNKVYLNGGSPYATAMAVSKFSKIIFEKKAISAADNVLNGDYSKVINNYDSATYYLPTWADDFEGTEINTDLWDVRWDEDCNYGNVGHDKLVFRGSSELKNNYVKDGNLYIDFVETETARYGGMLTTQDMMEYYMGYCELSAIHPRGQGLWVSLYNMSGTSTGDTHSVGYHLDNNRLYYTETDVEECYGGGDWIFGNTYSFPTDYCRELLNIPDKVPYTGSTHVNNRLAATDDRGFWMDFHTYGYELLDNTRLAFTCDGYIWSEQALREGAEQMGYDQPVFLRLGMAAGTKNHPISDDPADSAIYNQYIVDYVHIYQHKGNKIYTKPFTSGNSAWVEKVIG